MKKFTVLVTALAICAAMLVGCGCMNSDAQMTTAPTTMPTTMPTTAAPTQSTTAPTTAATTMPETQPTALDGSTNETAGENGVVEPESTGSGSTSNSKSRTGRIPSMG